MVIEIYFLFLLFNRIKSIFKRFSIKMAVMNKSLTYFVRLLLDINGRNFQFNCSSLQYQIHLWILHLLKGDMSDLGEEGQRSSNREHAYLNNIDHCLAVSL